MTNEICKTKIPPRKQQPCLAQLAEKSVASQNQQPNEPQAQQTESLVAGQRRIQLTQGQVAIIDEDDFERVSKFNWFAMKMGKKRKRFYAYRRKSKKEPIKQMHRLVFGDLESGFFIDHINGDTLDNRKCNLRAVTNFQNCIAFKKKQTGKTSKYRGVNFHHKKWRAAITFNKKPEHLGMFDSEIEAAQAWNKRAIELGFYPEALNKFD